MLGLFPDAGPWHPLVLAREAAGAAVTVFAVVLVVAERRRPLALPQEQMLPRARERYAKEDSWVSPRHPEQVLDAVVRAFGSPGARTTRIGDSALVELSRGYRPAAGQRPWRHQDAVKHLKFRPAVLFFAIPGPKGTGTRIHAFSQDGQRTGLYDMLSLADEMAASALAAAREATSGTREADA